MRARRIIIFGSTFSGHAGTHTPLRVHTPIHPSASGVPASPRSTASTPPTPALWSLERVQRGAFGACLMAEPALVAQCVRAIRDAVAKPVTVKHRIGIDQVEDYGFVRDFVGAVADAGCRTFIVHARNAVLKGLSP